MIIDILGANLQIKIVNMHSFKIFINVFALKWGWEEGDGLEQRRRRAGIRRSDAYAFGYGWRNSVDRNLRIYALRFCSGSINNDRERNKACAACICFLCIFVEEFPSWLNLDGDVAIKVRIETISDFQDVVVASQQSVGSIHVANSCAKHEEFLRTAKHVV